MPELIIFLILLFLGWVFGKANELKHYASIKKREALSLSRPAVNLQHVIGERVVEDRALAVGSVVISVDYLKRFLSNLRNIFGGEMNSYSSLIDRARREALLRMKESCPHAHLYINTRVETSSIFQGQKDGIGSVEVMAYSTAVTFANENTQQSA